MPHYHEYFTTGKEKYKSEVKKKLNYDLKFSKKERDEDFMKELIQYEIENKKESFEDVAKDFEKNHCKIVNKVLYITETEEKNIFYTATN